VQIIQAIGAVAGLAAIVGLAVLAALHRSQARDVRRLRTWARRAPERLEAGMAVPGRAAGVHGESRSSPSTAAPSRAMRRSS
jgi:hypothetical protein